MDYGRAGYITQMRLSEDSDELTPVRWYFADRDANVFRGLHRFVSSVWELDDAEAPDWEPYDGLGEPDGAPFVFDPGANVLATLGLNICGAPELFFRGARADDPHWTTDADGRSPCCARADQQAGGGATVGGTGFDLVDVEASSLPAAEAIVAGLYSGEYAPGELPQTESIAAGMYLGEYHAGQLAEAEAVFGFPAAMFTLAGALQQQESVDGSLSDLFAVEGSQPQAESAGGTQTLARALAGALAGAESLAGTQTLAFALGGVIGQAESCLNTSITFRLDGALPAAEGVTGSPSAGPRFAGNPAQADGTFATMFLEVHEE